MMPFLTRCHTFWAKFIHLIENIDIQSIYVIGYIDHNNLWWMKLCVYGNVDTNVICHMCKMNYVTHMDQIITWMNLCSWNMHMWKMNFLPKRSWLWWMDDNITSLKFDNMGEIKILDDNFSSYIFVEKEILYAYLEILDDGEATLLHPYLKC